MSNFTHLNLGPDEPENKKIKFAHPSPSEIELQNVKDEPSEFHDEEPHNLQPTPVLTMESNIQEEINIRIEETDNGLDGDQPVDTSQNGCVSSSEQEGGTKKKNKTKGFLYPLSASSTQMISGSKTDKYYNESITETEMDAMILESNLNENDVKPVTSCLLFSNISYNVKELKDFIIMKCNTEAKEKQIVFKNILRLPTSVEGNHNLLIIFTPKEGEDWLYNTFNGLEFQGKTIHVRRDSSGDLTLIYQAIKRNKPTIMARTKMPYPTKVFQQLSNFTNIDAKYHYTQNGLNLTKMYGLKPECIKALNLPTHRTNTNIILVENLNPKMNKSDIREVFSMAGLVMNVSIKRYPATDRLLTFITYDHPLEAIQAVLMFHRHEIYYRRVKVILYGKPYHKILQNGYYTRGPGLGPNGQVLMGARTFCELNIIRQEVNDLKNSIKDRVSQNTDSKFGPNFRNPFINSNNSSTMIQTPHTDKDAIKISSHIVELQKLRKEFYDFRKSINNDKDKNSFQQNDADKNSSKYMSEIKTLRQEFVDFKKSISQEIENQVKQARLEIAESLNLFCHNRIDALLKYKVNNYENLNPAKLVTDVSKHSAEIRDITRSNSNNIEKVSNDSKDTTKMAVETNFQSSRKEINELIQQTTSNETNVPTEQNSTKTTTDAVKTLQELMAQGNSIKELAEILDTLKNAEQVIPNKNKGTKVIFETNNEIDSRQNVHEKYNEIVVLLGRQKHPDTSIPSTSDKREALLKNRTIKEIKCFDAALNKPDTEHDDIISITPFQNNVMMHQDSSVSPVQSKSIPIQSHLVLKRSMSSRCMTPQVMQPQMRPSQSMQQNLMQPQLMQPQLIQPQLMQPQLMQPQLMQPQLMQPQLMQPQMMPSQSMTSLMMPPQSAMPFFMQPQPNRLHQDSPHSIPSQATQTVVPHISHGSSYAPISLPTPYNENVTVVFKNLPPNVTYPILMKKLSEDFPTMRIVKFSKDGAHVQLENKIDAERCIHKYHRSLVDKVPIDVVYA